MDFFTFLYVFIALSIGNIVCAVNLNDKIFLLQEKIMTGEISYSDIEANYIALLNDAQSDKDKILILTELIKESGKNTSPDKVIKYCNDMFSLPLKSTEKCFAISRLGRALEEQKRDPLEAGEVYLKGLVIAAQKITSDEIQSPPAVGKYRYTGESDKIKEELEERHNKEMKQREQVIENNELLRYREQFTNNCIAVFSMIPDRRNDYLRILDKYLENYPIIKEKIISAMQETWRVNK